MFRFRFKSRNEVVNITYQRMNYGQRTIIFKRY